MLVETLKALMPTNKRKPVTPEYSPGEYLPEIFIDEPPTRSL
jgi:hypothetical protein